MQEKNVVRQNNPKYARITNEPHKDIGRKWLASVENLLDFQDYIHTEYVGKVTDIGAECKKLGAEILESLLLKYLC